MGDIAVQKATCTFTSTGTTADATITSVDMDYTFLLVPQGFTGAGHGSFTGNQEDTLVHVRLLNATTVRATRAVGGTTPTNAVSIEVWVIEDTSPGAWFQVLGRGVRAGSTSTATHNESHTAAASTDNIVALVHGGCHDTRADYASWRPARNTTSSTTFTRGNTASGSYEYSWEVIEFVESGWTVKEHVLVDNAGVDVEDPHTISTLSDLSKAALIRGGVEADGFRRAPDEIYVGHYPDTVTNVDTITDESSWSAGVTITCYSIHHADLSVQRNASFNGGSMSNFSGTSANDTITAVTAIAECALVVSQSGNSAGYTDYAEDVIWGDITTTTNVQLQRANSNDGSVDVAYEVIDFSGLTSDFARTAYGAINLSGWASGGAGADEHTTTVEIAFSHSTKTTAPGESDWTDVTADVLESPKIKITRGSDRAMQKVNPGRLEFTLNNTSRDYERGYNGAHGTDGFKPGRPVRVFVDYRPAGKFNTRRYMRFVGFIRSGKPTYFGKAAIPAVRVTALDQLSILGRNPGPTDAPTEIDVGTPFAYYKLLEASGTTATDDGSGANNGTYGGSYTLANLAWSTVDTTRKHVQFNGADADGVSATLTGVTSTGAMTMLAWVRPTAVDATNVLWDHTVAELGPTGSNNAMSFTLSVRPDGTLHYRHGALKQALSDPNVDTDLSTLNEWHMIAVTRSATGEVRGYIDGSLTSVGAQDVSGEPIPSNTALGIGLGQHSAAGASSMGYDGHIGDVAIYTDELSAGRIAAIYAGQVTARPAEDAGARIDAILNGIGVPAAWREIAQGDSTLQTVTLDSAAKALALIQRAAESDHGRVYVDRFGRVRFENRWYRSHVDRTAVIGDYRTLSGVTSFTAPASNNDEDVMATDASFAIAGDIDVRWLAKKTSSSGTQKICGNWFFGATKSWNVEIIDDDVVFSTSGTGGSDSNLTTTESLTAHGIEDGDWFYGRAVYDVSRSTAFVWCRRSESEPWQIVGEGLNGAQTALNTTSTSIAMFQDVAGGLASEVAWFEVYDGIDGTRVARCDAADSSDTTSAFTGSVDGHSWDPQGPDLTRTVYADRTALTDDVVEEAMSGLVVDDNEERLINRARVTRAGGEEQVATNSSSLDEHGEFDHTPSTDLDVADDAEALTLAEVLVNQQADPDRVITSLTLNPRKDPQTLYPIVLEMDVSSRFMVRHRPDEVFPGVPIEQDSFVEGVTETIGAKDWVTMLKLSPASTSGFWRLGFSQLGVDTRLGY